MTSGQKNMDNKSYDQLLIMQATIESNRKYYDERMKNITEHPTEIIASMMDNIKISKSSLYKKDPQKAKDNTTMVSSNKKAPPLEVGHSTKNGCLWALKN